MNEPDFWDIWNKTKLGLLRSLSRQKVKEYYDFFAWVHYSLDPVTKREQSVAALDRMVALQSELEFRRTRDIQIFVATIGAVVLIAVAIFEHNKPCNENASTEHPKTQTAPAQPLSSSQPSPESN